MRIKVLVASLINTKLQLQMKGTEVPNPRRSSACDCTCVLTRIDHCLVNNSIHDVCSRVDMYISNSMVSSAIWD